MYNDRVRYTIETKEEGKFVVKNDPIGWDKDVRTIERSLESLSFVTKYSDNLRFVKDEYRFLYRYSRSYVPQGEAILIREEKNPNTDDWEIIYSESLDLKKYRSENEIFDSKFLSGGFDELIKNQINEKYELDRTEDILGNSIIELDYDRIGLTGRKLFLESLLENREEFTHIAEFEPLLGTITIRFINDHNITYESDDLINPVIGVSDFRKVTFTTQWELGAGQMFYGPSDRSKTLKIRFRGNPQITFTTLNPEVRQYLVIAQEQAPGLYVGSTGDQILISEYIGIQASYQYDVTLEVEVLKGQVLAFVTDLTASTNSPTTYTESEKSVSIFIEEDSSFPATQNKCLKMHDALKRQIEIITGSKSNFRSDYLKNGQFKDLLISSGKMIRNLPKLDEDNNPSDVPESITTSLKDLLSVKGYLNLGYGVITEGGNKKFIVEDLKFFFQNFVSIRLGEVSEVSRTWASDFSWRSATFGNDKAGEYEEQQGRFETNASNTYQLYTSLAEKKYDGTSDLRSDLIGVEYARRKNYSVSPTEDTEYDKDNFIFDAAETDSGVFNLRRWPDEYISEPKKLYDPDSAGNFRLSPLECMERHAWLLKTSLEKFPDESIRYSSTTGYSEMITQKPGDSEKSQNGSFLNSSLEKARFDDEIIEFNKKMTFEIRKFLYGSTKIGDRDIPNIFGLVEFIDERTKTKEYGWILTAKESELGEFKVIKAQISNA